MSLDALRWAMSRRMDDASAKLLLVVLADCHNAETGRCDPSLDFLCERACLARATCKEKMQALIAAGLVTRVARFAPNGAQRSSAFMLHLDRGDQHTTRQMAPADQQDPELAQFGYSIPRVSRIVPNLGKRQPFVGGPESTPPPATQQPPPRPLSGPPGGHMAAPEPGSIEPGSIEPMPAKPAKGRNLTWEALAKLDGWTDGSSMPKTGAANIGRAVKELREASPEMDDAALAAEVEARAGRYRSQWRQVTLTASALVKHWSKFAAPTPTAQPRKRWQISAGIEELEREIEMHPANQNLWVGGGAQEPSAEDAASLDALKVRLHSLRQELNHADE